MNTASVMSDACDRTSAVNERLQRVLSIHLDLVTGSSFWLNRASECGIESPTEIHCIADLQRFGEMTQSDLRAHPIRDFIPRCFHDRLDEFVIGQTGGTTGVGAWTAYREDEFREAFITPFVVAANALGFPRGESWLYVGPSGPHIIGKVVRHLANEMKSADPFTVDFDPRWARKLPEGSFASKRYLDHVVAQAMDVISHEQVGVLFTTPPLLERLAAEMNATQRSRITAVHYGGMAVTPAALLAFQQTHFPNAVHLSGYGNTLFGCCLELSTPCPRELEYFPHGDRLLFETIGENRHPSERGQVCFTRLDESFLIIRMLERDNATLVPPPTDAPRGFHLVGLRNPSPPPVKSIVQSDGLY